MNGFFACAPLLNYPISFLNSFSTYPDSLAFSLIHAPGFYSIPLSTFSDLPPSIGLRMDGIKSCIPHVHMFICCLPNVHMYHIFICPYAVYHMFICTTCSYVHMLCTICPYVPHVHMFVCCVPHVHMFISCVPHVHMFNKDAKILEGCLRVISVP